MTKVALYIRVSTNEQVLSGYSFNEQRDVLLSYCRERKWEVFKVYADAGISGKTIKRPSLQNLIKDSENQNFEVVLFWRLDRLARNTLETLKLVHENFLANGIEVASMRESFDTTTDFGRFILTLFAAQAERELATTRERMSLGRYGRVKNGKALIGGTRPFGYNYSTHTGLLSVNEAEAKIVKQIYKDFLKGMSINKIKVKLNKAGHLEKEKNWHVSIVRAVLTNPIYCGAVKIKDLTFDGLHEAIISKWTFKKAQKILIENREKIEIRNNNKLPFKIKYMLSGILKCGYCGTPLEIFTTRTKQKTVMIHGYRCKNKYPRKDTLGVTTYNNNQKCDSPCYSRAELENFVISQIVKIQNDDSFFSEICKKDENYYDKLAKVKKLIGFESFENSDYDLQKVIIRALVKSITVKKDDIVIEWEI